MIQSLQRAASILRMVSTAGAPVRLTDLVKELRLNKTTLFHLSETLVAEGLLSKSEAGYEPGVFWKESARPRGAWWESLMPACSELHRRFPAASLLLLELGESDLFTRFAFDAGAAGRPRKVDNQTHNPYYVTSGILHFAFAAEEKLFALRLHHPFETRGLEVWKSQRAFSQAVEAARRQGFAETPNLTPPDQYKIGLPLMDPKGQFRATLTFQAYRRDLPNIPALRRTLVSAAKKIFSTKES